MKMNIYPYDKSGSHKTGTISGLTKKQIQKILGFKPNLQGDADKIKYEWGFYVDSSNCNFSIWDYKGSHKYNQFSTYGPHEIFLELFGANYVAETKDFT